MSANIPSDLPDAEFPGFPTDRVGYVAALRAHIAGNHNVVNATRALHYILSIPEPIVPPDLASLPEQVSNRILVLRLMLDSEEGREPDNFKNIQALIEGYTSGTLTIDTDDRSVVCYFFNGKQKTGWLGMHDYVGTMAGGGERGWSLMDGNALRFPPDGCTRCLPTDKSASTS